MNIAFSSTKRTRKLTRYFIYTAFLACVTLSGNMPVTVFSPRSVQELVSYVKNNSVPLSILGAGYSQGGQTQSNYGTQVDMQHMCSIIYLNLVEKQITVPARATWKQIQQYIDPYNLSVQVMQSYNDFSVGGSISVNIHGRDLRGQMIETIREITVLLANGSIVKANRDEHYDLFRAAIGGYGLVGIIIDVTLQLTDNMPIKLVIDTILKNEYGTFFEQHIRNNPSIQLHNAVIYPHDFTTLISHSWEKTDDHVTIQERLQKEKIIHAKELFLEQLVRRIPLLHGARPSLEPKLYTQPTIVYRNYEMSHTVKSIEPLVDFLTTSILQEYFIPVKHFESFINDLERIKKEHRINIMNISVRFVPENQESFLSYAPTDRFAFVLYIDVLNPKLGFLATEKWTKKLIDAALSYGGTYYLPYGLYATKEQFQTSYKNVDEFLAIKKQYDPNNRFVNTLWQKYMQ